MKIGIVSLGCDKNTVDTEKAAARLINAGAMLVADPSEADIILVNTCAFIDSAKKESIAAIMEMAAYKKKKCRKLIVMGCMANRYYDELKTGIPEADEILRIRDYNRLEEIVFGNVKPVKKDKPIERMISTPEHYAYLKVSEGCNNRCSYCAIPAIRGPYRSETLESLTDEAKRLIDTYSVKELVLVAQDVTRYGTDLYGAPALMELLDRLETLDIEWIRLMYCYPELVTDSLISRVAAGGKVVPYLDMPLQHISDSVLKRMNRRNTKADAYSLIDRIRKVNPAISLRSTFIVGFPGETEEDFKELEDFVRYAGFNNCGFFKYSREENTPAYSMDMQIPAKVKQARLQQMYGIQTEIVLKRADALKGSVLKVLYEGVDYDRGCYMGRAYMSAPGVDSGILFSGKVPPDVGQFVNVRITGRKKLDLTGVIAE